MITTLAVLLGLALGWILADVLDIGRRWEDRQERKRLKKRFLEAYKAGGAYVISGQMDPQFVPPSGSLNPNATHAPMPNSAAAGGSESNEGDQT